MGFIKAFAGALGGTFANEWLDYLMPKSDLPNTALIFPAVAVGTNAGRGENTKGSENVITNGSKILVPENTCLITIQDGAITGCVAEPGGYIFSSDDPNSKSFFSGGGLLASTFGASWDKFKFGGQASSKQTAIYVNLREIPDNKFGTTEPVRWMDNYFESQVGGVLRGSYTLKVIDPILLVKNFVPPSYLLPNAPVFDMQDMENEYCTQLHTDVVSQLSQSLQNYASEKARENNNLSSIESIKSDTIGLAKAISNAVEESYQWRSTKGLEIVKVNIVGFDYDEDTKKLLAEFQQDDKDIRRLKRMGEVYSENPAAIAAAGTISAMDNASKNGNGAMMGFMGMNVMQQAGGSVMSYAQQQAPQMSQTQQPQMQSQMQPQMQPQATAGAVQATVAPDSTVAPTDAQVPTQPAAPSAPSEDPYAKLTEMKKLLDSGVITQADFDAVKSKLLGI